MNFSAAAPPSRGAVAASAQDLSEAEFRELDELLAAVPEPLEPLDAVMLDGFLCGVLVQPQLIDADAWLPYVFDAGGHRWGEAEPAAEQLRARALILRRQAALNRSIAEYGGFDPFVLEPLPPEADAPVDADASAPPDPVHDAPSDAAFRDTIGPWVAGFEQALQLLPGLVEMDEPEVSKALAGLWLFLPDEARTTHADATVRAPPIASLDAAIGAIVAAVANLYDFTAPLRYKVESLRRDTPKVGRNDPCPCGSGRKFKQCHGAAPAATR